MSNLPLNSKWRKHHFGWIVTLGCAIVMLYTVGLTFNCMSMYLNPLMTELNISNTLRSSLTMFFQLGSAISLLLVSKVIAKVGSRKSILLFSLVMAVGYLILSLSNIVTICSVAMFIIGVGYGLCGIVPVTFLLTNWFEKKKGLALGIAMSGSGVATLFAPTIIDIIISELGVRSAAIIQAVIITVLAVIAVVIIKEKPEEKGCLAYGFEDSQKLISEIKTERGKKSSLIKAIKDVNFILMSIILLILGMIISPLVQHLSPVISQSGYTERIAAEAVSTYGICMLFGKPLFGSVIDRLGIPKANTYVYALILIALIDGLMLGNNTIQVFIIPLLLACGSAPMATVGLPIWSNELFGKTAMKDIFPILKLVYTVGGVIGASLPGIIIDQTGSYAGLFKLYIAFLAVTYLLLQYLFIIKKSSTVYKQKDSNA